VSPSEIARREHQQEQSLLADYYDEEEAARQLRHTVRALRAWRGQQRGPAWIKIGKSVFYKISAIEAWLKSLEKPVRSQRRL
jgi:hypothetical protein